MQFEFVEGLEGIVLRSHQLRLVVLPGLGGKIISLRSAATGREYAWRDPHRSLRRTQFGDDFGAYDISGIDDCFPTVDACVYPEGPLAGSPMVDHGELWSRPWQWSILDDGIALTIDGVHLPYRLVKHIRVDQDAGHVCFTYRIAGRGAFPIAYLWVGHPLLAVEPGSRVLVPGHPPAYTAFAMGNRVAVSDESWQWPHAPTPSGTILDYSTVESTDRRSNDKVWLRSPAAGWCALQHPGADELLRLNFDPNELPWLGVCVNHAGWPEEHPGYWLALEPGTSRHDALDRTMVAGDARILVPGEEATWSWSVGIVPGDAGP